MDDRMAMSTRVETVQARIARLDAETRAQIRQVTDMGRTVKGLAMHGFCGTPHVMDQVQLGLDCKQVATIKVFPAADWHAQGRVAEVGETTQLFVLDTRAQFVATLPVSLSLAAQFDAMRAVEALIRVGAADRNDPQQCLLCAEEHLFLSCSLGFPRACFDNLVLVLHADV